MRKSILFAAGMLVSLAVLAAEPLKILNVKTGQWEMTMNTSTSGAPPVPEAALAKMTPEQRAKLEAMFGNSAAPRVHKSMECITKEDLTNPFHPEKEENCEMKVITSTSTTQDIATKCKGDHPSSGHMRVEASSPESIKATVDMVVEGGKTPTQIKTQMTGRWIGPTCKDDE